MKVRAFALIPIVAGLLFPAVALAQPVYPQAGSPSDGAAVISKLQKQEQIDELKAKFWSQEPLTQQDYYVQEREDRHLIARISAGQPVSRDDLAEALKHIDTPY
jgi:hypothetical protein